MAKTYESVGSIAYTASKDAKVSFTPDNRHCRKEEKSVALFFGKDGHHLKEELKGGGVKLSLSRTDIKKAALAAATCQMKVRVKVKKKKKDDPKLKVVAITLPIK